MISRSTALLTCCLLFIPLIYIAYTTPSSDRRTQWFSNCSQTANPVARHKLLLGRLVRGDDQNKLEATSFACDCAPHSVVCVANQPARVDPANLKIHVPLHDQNEPQQEILVQPYARQEDKDLMRSITPVHILQHMTMVTPESCSRTHDVPVVVFSSGLIGNIFHEISEIIIPLFITSRHFRSSVQFMITDYHPWFVQKYNRVLTRLSHYQVIDMASDTGSHCFPGAVVGLKYHGNLALDPTSIPGGYTMLEFKQFLRETYGLKIKNAKEIQKPLLLLISREKTRTFVNKAQMVSMMEDMGFLVIITTTKDMLNLDEFSQVVNSCNVIAGAHGAGLTNMIFLPQGSVLVQVVPYALTWAADTYYGQPALKMELKYLEYKTVAEESSLMDSYGPNDPVISEPAAVFSRGYRAARAIYIDGQNITVNLTRFRVTLVEALVHLGHPLPSN